MWILLPIHLRCHLYLSIIYLCIEIITKYTYLPTVYTFDFVSVKHDSHSRIKLKKDCHGPFWNSCGCRFSLFLGILKTFQKYVSPFFFWHQLRWGFKFTTYLVIIIVECQLLDFNYYSQVIKHNMSFENWLRVIVDWFLLHTI